VLKIDDQRELTRLVRDAVRGQAMNSFLARLKQDHDHFAVEELFARCSFDHCASLVFPDSFSDVQEYLVQLGLQVSDPVPSTVVRRRLTQRYNVQEEDLDVRIIRAVAITSRGDPSALEIFCLPSSPAVQPIEDQERMQYNERHLALLIREPGDASIGHLRTILIERLLMTPDGGGYNPHDAASGGRSVLYFRSPTGHRLELTCTGNFSRQVARHLRWTSMAEPTLSRNVWTPRRLRPELNGDSQPMPKKTRDDG
jgi:hypothetical protein